MSYIFGKTAKTYDKMGFDTGVEAIGFLELQLNRVKLKVGSLIDVACGTGTFALLCASRRPWNVSGLDASKYMLEIAREKAGRSKVLVHFIHADLRSFQSRRTWDVATCWSGSLNYLLTLGALQAALGNVARMLRSQGLFVFDVNTELEYKRQDGMFHFTHLEDFVEARNHHVDPKTGLFYTHITSFVRLPKGNYERLEEHQKERPYNVKQVQQALEKTGFKERTFFADFAGNPLGEKPRQFVCVAVRN